MNVLLFYYIIGRITIFIWICRVGAFISFLIMITLTALTDFISEEDLWPVWKKWQKKCLCIFIILCCLIFILPSKEEMIIFYVIPKIQSNEKLQEIPEKILNLFNKSIILLDNKISNKLKKEE